MDLESAARQLTIEQPCLTFYEAQDLLLDAYRRHRKGLGYGNLTQACMKITWGILLRLSEEQLRDRLDNLSLCD